MNAPESVPAEIYQQVLVPLGVLSIESVPPGMSGAQVFRCQLPGGQVRALKQWPEGTPLSRVAEVDRVVQASYDHGLELTPRLHSLDSRGATCLVLRDRCWQLMDWMPGEPLPCSAPLDQIESGAEAIARFHASVRALGWRSQPADAIRVRLQRTHELTPKVAQLMELGPSSGFAELDPVVAASLYRARQVLIWKWDEVAARITRTLNPFLKEPLHTQFVLRDIHCDNALFLGGHPSGLIDFDAVQFDTPWTDLARWTGSFLGGTHQPSQVWDAAMAGFCRNHPLNHSSEVEFGRQLAAHLCFATLWIGLANWLVWLILEKRTFGARPEIIAARIQNVLQAAESPLSD
jgi:Ser/Thr protein kinase RdoA (MazF antagonist)